MASRSSPRSSALRYLMCPPDHFAVTYTINPWMDPEQWARDAMRSHRTAKQQWDDLVAALVSNGANVYAMASPPGLPDLVFTANAAVVLDRKVLMARFRHGERRGEEPVYNAVFQALHVAGFVDDLFLLPDDVVLEGAGDCIWDPARALFWLGHGFRSDIRAAACVETTFGQSCVPLQLADARFYHLDTALCALPCGGVLHYPGAFTPRTLDTLYAAVAPQDRIALDGADACAFAANAVITGNTIVMSRCSPALLRILEERGYAVVQTPLDCFLQSGGSACCLTLRLDHRAATPAASAVASDAA